MIRNYAKRQTVSKNLWFISTKNCFERKFFFTFYLNQRFVTKNWRRHNLYAIIRKKTLLNIRLTEFFKINEKQNFCQNKFKICDSLYL